MCEGVKAERRELRKTLQRNRQFSRAVTLHTFTHSRLFLFTEKIVTTIFGIKHCDTMKKAFAWLDDHGVRYDFHDYKSAGIDAAKLEAWSKQVGWQTLLNTRGTTWRKLSPSQQANIDETKALRLMRENPSLIKRPVLENGSALMVGFVPERYVEAFRK